MIKLFKAVKFTAAYDSISRRSRETSWRIAKTIMKRKQHVVWARHCLPTSRESILYSLWRYLTPLVTMTGRAISSSLSLLFKQERSSYSVRCNFFVVGNLTTHKLHGIHWFTITANNGTCLRVFALDTSNRYGHWHSSPVEGNPFSHPEVATEACNTEEEEEKEGPGRDRRRRGRSSKKGRGQTTGSSLHSFEFRIQIDSNVMFMMLESTSCL